MKTIVFVLERLGNGGAERVTAALSKKISEAGNYNVHIFTYVKEENEYKLPDEVTRHIMSQEHIGRITSLKRKVEYLTKEIRSVRPDYVISLATPKTSILLTILSLKRNFTLILSERNDPNQYPKEVIYKVLRNFVYRICDGVVFQTPDAQAYFSKKIQRRSTVIPNPISESLPERYTHIREKKIVNFCRLEPQKNLKLLLVAFEKINKEFADYKLDIYGEGEQYTELVEFTKKLGIADRVVFKGFVQNIHAKIINASLFVSSSNYEGISNSMLEALAMGVPTISTDCPIGGARMVIKNAYNGILVPVNNADSLAKAMKEVLSNNSLSERLSFNGTKLKYEFSVDSISRKWLDFLQEAGKHEDN